MRFSFVFAVVAALTASVSAKEAAGESCPSLCNELSCCAGQRCVPTFVDEINTVVDYCDLAISLNIEARNGTTLQFTSRTTLSSKPVKWYTHPTLIDSNPPPVRKMFPWILPDLGCQLKLLLLSKEKIVTLKLELGERWNCTAATATIVSKSSTLDATLLVYGVHYLEGYEFYKW
ncbi:hypothetical protein DEU56DRAFT_949404 [Suillus clintonianus]|uniref:uncharacterized protein n=1 Tax=Suillus clintonianus TaxID=1904413 RepID=UPI001B87957B|nr:uncharacterized protein DEU56DRAFT_949404 [Suillus clintonianus]KAG2135097.1 hypothetical protein DEU56DRAFT_949404 [Suillus clintonianus]